MLKQLTLYIPLFLFVISCASQVGEDDNADASEPNQLMQFSLNIDENLVAHWPFEEGAGSVAVDTTGNHDGTVEGAVHDTDRMLGDFSLRFDGTDDRVQIEDLNIYGSAITLAAWINPYSLNQLRDQRIISKADGIFSDDHEWMISTYDGDQLRFRLRADGGTSTLISSSQVLEVDTWAHVAAVYDGEEMRLYKNGELIASRSKSGDLDVDTGAATMIGDNPVGSGYAFDGLIDDVRIYGRALSSTEVEELFAYNGGPECETDSDCDALDRTYCDGTSLAQDDGICTDGTCQAETTVLQTCDSACGASCSVDADCAASDCDDMDGCVGDDYYDYDDVANTCLSDCTCSVNTCVNPTISIDDPRCVTVTLNEAPIVDAGINATTTFPNPLVTLNGSVSDDGIPNEINILWEKVSGPGEVVFENASVSTTNATFDAAGSYILRLSATDSELSASDEMIVLVYPPVPENTAPVIDAGNSQETGMGVETPLVASMIDDALPVAATVAWSLASGPGTVLFGDSSALNTTATFDTAGVYLLRLTATDTELTAHDDVMVIVSTTNTAPVVDAGPDRTITLTSGSTALDGSVSDDGLPIGGTLTTEWSLVSGPEPVTFENAAAVDTTAQFSSAGTYVLQLVADDSELQTSDQVTISVGTTDDTPFVKSIIDSDVSGDVKAVGDIDGDGYLDLVAGGQELAWYPYPNWNKVVIANSETEFTTDGAVADMDNDGDLDIVVPDGATGNNLKWFENPRPLSDPESDPWSLHLIGNIGSWGKDVEPGDYDNNGLTDVAIRTSTEVFIFFQTALDSWLKIAIIDIDEGEGMVTGDVDQDGDDDIVLPGYWLENPLESGTPTTDTWEQYEIADLGYTTIKAVVVDLNDDGSNDVLFSCSECETAQNISWFETSDPRNGPWTEHNLKQLSHAHTLQVADIDLDGRLDVITAQMHQSAEKEIIVFHNQGNALNWYEQVIDTTGLHNGVVADIGNDGDFDLYGSNWVGNPPIRLYVNQLN